MVSAQFIPLVAVAPVILAAAWTDLRMMRIPNPIVFVALAVFALTVPFPGMSEVLWRVMAGMATFVVCFVLFAARIVGGGDAKLFPVIMLFIPTALWAEFFIVFSFSMVFAMGLLLPVRHFAPVGGSQWKSLTPDGRFPMATAFATAVVAFIGVFAIAW